MSSSSSLSIYLRCWGKSQALHFTATVYICLFYLYRFQHCLGLNCLLSLSLCVYFFASIIHAMLKTASSVQNWAYSSMTFEHCSQFKQCCVFFFQLFSNQLKKLYLANLISKRNSHKKIEMQDILVVWHDLRSFF